MKYSLLSIFLLLTSLSWGQNPVQKNDILVQGYSKTIDGTQFWYYSALFDVVPVTLVDFLSKLCTLDGSMLLWKYTPCSLNMSLWNESLEAWGLRTASSIWFTD